MGNLEILKIKLNELKIDKLNKRIIKIVALALVVLWCMIIFYLSHQDSSVSGSNSLSIIEFITDNILDTSIDLNILESINEIFRTFMHGVVYFVLSFLTLVALKVWDINNIYKTSIVFNSIYSITDEIHQYFIPDRDFQLSDIAIDFIGNIVGVIIFIILYKLLKLITKK